MNSKEIFLSHQGQTSPFPFLIEVERADGVFIYDKQGKKYTDLIAGVAVNNIGHRHPKVVEAIKARGIYDSELGDDIAKIMEESDNALVPADKSASFSAEKGLGNAIWFMPI